MDSVLVVQSLSEVGRSGIASHSIFLWLWLFRRSLLTVPGLHPSVKIPQYVLSDPYRPSHGLISEVQLSTIVSSCDRQGHCVCYLLEAQEFVVALG